jgi:hypothetical protein
MAKRKYDLVRTMVEEHGGKMWYERKGQPAGGAWMISYQGYEKAFPTVGHLFPGLDDLHVPKVQFPKSWDDFKNELLPDAWEKLVDALKQG